MQLRRPCAYNKVGVSLILCVKLGHLGMNKVRINQTSDCNHTQLSALSLYEIVQWLEHQTYLTVTVLFPVASSS